MSTLSQAIPRIFVSHSHADNDYCRAFVNGLRAHSLDVWYDEHNLGWGALRQVIEREMQAREHFIAILSPTAVLSEWVNAEIDAALYLLGRGELKTLLFVTADRCKVPLLLQRYKRIERADGSGYPAADAIMRVLPIVTTHLAVPTPSIPIASAPATPPARPSAPRSPTPSIPPDRFPPRLADLGFTAHSQDGVEYILPPLCDVSAGSFLMGSDKRRDPNASSPIDDSDELPQHTVTLPAYQIARFPVTVAEYACFVRAGQQPPGDWQSRPGKLDHPVVSVSWHEAAAYAAWLADLTAQPWCLPSEAEWEKAARGTDGRLYPWGDDFDASRCNISESGIRTTTPVGAYPTGASPCGAQDLAGNVWEWTASLHGLYPFRAHDRHHTLKDYSVPRYTSYGLFPFRTLDRHEAAEFQEKLAGHVQRGGSYYSDAWDARAACRSHDGLFGLDIPSDSRGIRLVLASPAS